MIVVTRLNGKEFIINAHMIETMEESPDTVITLNTERKFVVKESIKEIIKKTIEYNRTIFLEKKRVE